MPRKKVPSVQELQLTYSLDQAKELLNSYVRNGLGGALGFPGGGGVGWPNNPWSEQLSDPQTIFKNLRWFLLSNYRQVLSEAYVELPLLQTLVDVPVEDAFRGGLIIKSQELDEDEIRQLQIAIKRDGDIHTLGQAAKWNRLFGGAGLMAMTDQDPHEPLDVTAITKDSPLEFRAADMWELTWETQNAGGYNPTEQADVEFEYYNYYGEMIHESHVRKLKGLTAPSFIRPRLRGWGFSICEGLVRSLNQYLKATDLTFEVLDEFKVDVYRIKNLVNTLISPEGQQQIQKRFNMANWTKNYQNALIMDSEDEYVQKQLSFAGLAEVMQGIRMQVASDMRFPMVKLFGTPATGLGADDESSIEVYNMMVESQVRSKVEFDAIWMIELKCQHLFEFIPDDLEIEFKPLRELSALDAETVKTQVFTRAFQAKQGGELSTFEFRDICNKANVFPVSLDTLGDELNPDDPEIEEMVTEGTSNPADIDQDDAPIAKETKPGQTAKVSSPPTSKAPKSSKEPKNKEPKNKPLKTNTNSAEFQKASYEADGGDDQIDSRKEPFFQHPIGIDWPLWQKARDEAKKIPGVTLWKFAAWKYKQLGGKGLP